MHVQIPCQTPKAHESGRNGPGVERFAPVGGAIRPTRHDLRACLRDSLGVIGPPRNTTGESTLRCPAQRELSVQSPRRCSLLEAPDAGRALVLIVLAAPDHLLRAAFFVLPSAPLAAGRVPCPVSPFPWRCSVVSDLELIDAVAHVTGEDAHEIRRRGFVLTGPEDAGLEPQTLRDSNRLRQMVARDFAERVNDFETAAERI